jgi:O-antigen ligase
VVFLILLMGGAALVSRSRGGMVSLLGALLCMAGLAAYGRSGARRAYLLALTVALMFLGGLWIGGDILYGTIERLTEEIGQPGESIRVRLWTDALRFWLGSPVLGTGLGSFEVAFPLVRSLRAAVAFTHAESDWVQLLTDTGLLGLGLALATAASLWLALFRRFRQGGISWVRHGALAGLVILIGTALQGIGNFSIPIMSLWLYLAVALALGLRAS